MKHFSHFFLVLIALTSLTACSFDFWGSTPESSSPSEPAEMTLSSEDPSWGEPAAPITLIVFSDFQCPYCADFHRTLKQTEEKWINTGKLRLQYRDFPTSMHRHAPQAHLAAAAAHAQGKYMEFQDKLYKEQSIWSPQDSVDSYLEGVATELGLNMEKFLTDLKDPELKKEVLADRDDGRKAGVTGTPGFFINGQLKSGAYSYERLEKEFEIILGSL